MMRPAAKYADQKFDVVLTGIDATGLPFSKRQQTGEFIRVLLQNVCA